MVCCLQRQLIGFFPSIILADLLGHICLLVIGAFWSTLVVSVLQGSVLLIALFRAIIDQFSSKIFLILLFLILCLPPALDKIPLIIAISLFLSSLESFSVLSLRSKLGERVALWFALTPPTLKWQMTEQKNPFEVCKSAGRYNEFGCMLNLVLVVVLVVECKGLYYEHV